MRSKFSKSWLMGNLINNPRFRFSFRFSCCTTVVSSSDENHGECGIRLSSENGEVDADQRSIQQWQDSVSDSPSYEKT